MQPTAATCHPQRGFTLVELLAVVGIIGILLVAAISMVGGTPAELRKTTAAMLVAMIDEARATAITSRNHVVLAVETPSGAAGNQRVALFRAVDPFGDGDQAVMVVEPISRWRTIETGVVLIDGADAGFANPLDGPRATLRQPAKAGAPAVEAHILVFHPHGGLRLPVGDATVTLRVAEGAVRGGQPQPLRRGERIPETKIRVGRSIARAHLAN